MRACTLLAVLLSLGAQGRQRYGVLDPERIQVGVCYEVSGIHAIVTQVLDDKHLTATIYDRTDKQMVLVLCKCPTVGLADGRKTGLGGILGTSEGKCTGTKTLRTTSGGTRTLYVFEPVPPKE